MPERRKLLRSLAEKIANPAKARSVLAIDGVDGSGKTTFAHELAPLIVACGIEVIEASVDGFHNPRSIRYQRGKADPMGFFLDSYNYAAFLRYLIEPFKEGSSTVEIARFDHRTDQEVTDKAVGVSDRSILLVDGIFLHRNELCKLWDQSIFLEVPFEVSYARMAERDGSKSDPLAEENRRYFGGQTFYLENCQPKDRATFVIDNSDIKQLTFMRKPAHSLSPDTGRGLG